MKSARDCFTFHPPEPGSLLRKQQDTYQFTRDKIARNLIHYTLIESFQNFNAHGAPYPFVSPNMLRPGTPTNAREFELQNSALVILLDETIPDKLRKNFRCREGNRLCKENLHAVAPDMQDLQNYKWSMRHSNHPGFDNLLKMLLPLDYALLVQRVDNGDAWPFELTHFHVKVERLLDNAIRGLAIYLNYLERSLYELGELYVDLLEKKFFEYFNFYHNASGRRCAAVLAAQLLAWKKIPATIYISSQQTRRLTFLTTFKESEEIHIEQYILLKVDSLLERQLLAAAGRWPVDIRKEFLIQSADHPTLAILRTRYEHTEAGRPCPAGHTMRTLNPREKWIRLKDEALISIRSDLQATIECSLVYSRQPNEIKL